MVVDIVLVFGRCREVLTDIGTKEQWAEHDLVDHPFRRLRDVIVLSKCLRTGLKSLGMSGHVGWRVERADSTRWAEILRRYDFLADSGTPVFIWLGWAMNGERVSVPENEHMISYCLLLHSHIIHPFVVNSGMVSCGEQRNASILGKDLQACNVDLPSCTRGSILSASFVNS